MSYRTGFAASCALALAACATAQTTEPIPVRGETPGYTCSEAGLQQSVGRQATAELGAEMLRASGAAVLRWVPHGTVITMEYRANRLTVYLDRNNRIERVNCG